MRKLLVILLAAAACSSKLPEQEVQKIFSLHSYEEYSPQKISAALKDGSGLDGLDPRAAVLSAMRPLKARPSDKNLSSGLLLGERGGEYRLIKVFRGSPAELAGFRTGDEVLAVNGKAPSPELFRSAIGHSTSFILRAGRAGVTSALEADIPRTRVFFPQVFSFYEEAARSGFLRLGLFYDGSAAAALEAAEAVVRRGAECIVFDLRDNQGGVPSEAAAVLQAFAAKAGPVFEVRSRHPGYSSLFTAQSAGKFSGLRTVVLVNARTSMAAAVFARAMKEVSGAVIVGEPSSPAVSLVRAFSLGDGRGLQLTIARMFPPSGADLETAGMAPDVEARPAGSARIWDNSRETALLGDATYQKALELAESGSPAAGRGRLTPIDKARARP